MEKRDREMKAGGQKPPSFQGSYLAYYLSSHLQHKNIPAMLSYR